MRNLAPAAPVKVPFLKWLAPLPLGHSEAPAYSYLKDTSKIEFEILFIGLSYFIATHHRGIRFVLKVKFVQFDQIFCYSHED